MLQPIFTLNVFNDPTPDGLYGYRVRLLTERTSGFRFSVAELRVESKGIVGPGSKGRSTFWATPADVPARRARSRSRPSSATSAGRQQQHRHQGALPEVQALGRTAATATATGLLDRRARVRAGPPRAPERGGTPMSAAVIVGILAAAVLLPTVIGAAAGARIRQTGVDAMGRNEERPRRVRGRWS